MVGVLAFLICKKERFFRSPGVILQFDKSCFGLLFKFTGIKCKFSSLCLRQRLKRTDKIVCLNKVNLLTSDT